MRNRPCRFASKMCSQANGGPIIMLEGVIVNGKHSTFDKIDNNSFS